MRPTKKSRPIPPGAPGHPLKGSGKSSSSRPPSPPRGKGRAEEGVRPARVSTPRARPSLTIVYEDRDLIAVDKPAGLPVIAPEGSRSPNLYDLVTAHIQRRNPKGRAAVVHRLDRESSGVLVFGTSGKVKTILMAGWDKLAKERVYWAVVEGRMEAEEGRLVNYLAEAGPQRMKNVMPDSPGALRAVTTYRVRRSGRDYSLLELSLETGRKHQIRAQLAIAGHPIVGDERYGSLVNPLGRLGLHAVLLVLDHPTRKEVLTLRSPAPDEFEALVAGSRPKGPATTPPRVPARAPDASPSASRSVGQRPTGKPPRPRPEGGSGPCSAKPRGPGKGRPGPSSKGA